MNIVWIVRHTVRRIDRVSDTLLAMHAIKVGSSLI